MKPRIRALALILAAIVGVGWGFAAPSIATRAQAETHTADAPGQSGPIAIDLGAGEMLALAGRATAVYVANDEIADVQLRTPMLLYLFGKAAGETTLTVIGPNDEVLLSRRIQVRHNTVRLQELIAFVQPDAQVELASIRQSLVISGHVPSAEAAEDIFQLARTVIGEDGLILNHMWVGTPNQVNLRVRIAEVSRETTKRLGFSWDILKTAGEFSFGLATGGFISGAVDGSSILSLAKDGSGFDVNGLIDALDDQGLITVLAEPNLTALSGESANFLAGGEFPIPVPDGDDGAITIVFKKFGVSLAFMPVVLGDGRLHIKVSTEVSQLATAGAVAFNGFNIPALTVRQATTTVNLNSGQSFAIAGLLQNTTNQDVSGVTGLSEIPILGALFRSTDFQRDESELVVIVTPYVVRPTSGRLALPTDGFEAPTDADRMAHAADHTPRVPNTRRVPLNGDGTQGLKGPGGFLLR
ncbi:MAG: type II and III secretion system protein family protein [Alphaproteobacteria bacterium]